MIDRPAVYTALYGGVDDLIEPARQDLDVDWYCFTDDPSVESKTWEVVVRAGMDDDPRLSAKRPKLLPHRFLPQYRWTIWVDGNLAIDSPSFVREALGFATNGIALFRHPVRACIYHEAYACLARTDFEHAPVMEQVRRYREAGYPPRGGLYACGALVRDGASAVIQQLGESWMEECLAGSPRDQVSFPVVAQRLKVRPRTFPFHIGRASAWLSLARYLGLTPGTFPRYMLTEDEARELCSWRWFPPLNEFPVSLDTSGSYPRIKWLPNPWFQILRHGSRR